MSNNLPIEIKKENIFRRIFNFIKRCFGKDSRPNMVEEVTTITDTTNISEQYRIDNSDEKFSDVITKHNQKKTLEEIILIIEKNPETLEKLDVPKLEIIDTYYKEKIIEYKKRIASLS